MFSVLIATLNGVMSAVFVFACLALVMIILSALFK